MKIKKIAQDTMDPVYLDISAEEMLVDHYANLLPRIEDTARGAKGNKKTEEQSSKEIDMIINEIKSAINKIEDRKTKSKLGSLLVGFKKIKRLFRGKTERVASNSNTNISFIEELLYTYGEKICNTIKKYHSTVICFISCHKYGGEIIIQDDSGDILKVRVNDQFVIDSIVPYGSLTEIYPMYSVMFYQKYWKPIVESIGHFYISDASTLILPSKTRLPDIPKGEVSYTIEGWNSDKDCIGKVDIAFKGNKCEPAWIFQASKTTKIASVQSKYTEQDYFNAIVRCIDTELESISGRTGEVIQVIPSIDFIELDVDFGRGLGVVRLTERQVKIEL